MQLSNNTAAASPCAANKRRLGTSDWASEEIERNDESSVTAEKASDIKYPSSPKKVESVQKSYCKKSDKFKRIETDDFYFKLNTYKRDLSTDSVNMSIRVRAFTIMLSVAIHLITNHFLAQVWSGCSTFRWHGYAFQTVYNTPERNLRPWKNGTASVQHYMPKAYTTASLKDRKAFVLQKLGELRLFLREVVADFQNKSNILDSIPPITVFDKTRLHSDHPLIDL